MDEKIKQRRIRAARNATASTRIEYPGFIPDPRYEIWIQQWINQEISSQELHDLVLNDIKNKYCNKE